MITTSQGVKALYQKRSNVMAYGKKKSKKKPMKPRPKKY